MDAITLGVMGAGETAATARLISLAFATTGEQATAWMLAAGHENFRVLKDGERAVGSLLRIPMGQYLGGKCLKLMGIAGVAVAPECRGRGYARAMMELAMREAAAEGFTLGGLYASTQTLYRQIGFEQSAYRFRVELPLAGMGLRERSGAVEALGDGDMEAVRRSYRRYAARWDGMLERGAYIWNRIRSYRGAEYTPFGVRGADGELDGYLFVNQVRKPESGRQNLELSDFVFHTPEAGRRLLGLLADFGMMADQVGFFGGPTHPALLLLPQQRHTLTSKDTHLTRVLDVKAAIEGRGYNPAVKGRVEMEIEDELIEGNAGKFVVSVEDGKGRIERGGRGLVKMHVRGLAAIFGGFVTPAQAGMLGWAEGRAEDLEAANVFAGSTPWVWDMY